MISKTIGPAIRLSIITVVRNGAGSLARAMDSVINQGRQVEYLVIDGGSTDGSVEVIRQRQAHLAYWCSEPDHGIADAFNKGLRRATGDVIGILNADDWYEPGVLQKIVHAFSQSTVDVIHGRVCYWRNGVPVWVADGSHQGLRRSGSVNHPSVFVHRSIYRRWGLFDLGYRYAMDYELMLRWLVHGVRFAYLPVTLANMSLGGISDVQRMRALREVRSAQRRHIGGPGPEYQFHWLCVRTKARQLLESCGAARWVALHGARVGDMRKTQV